MNRSGHTRNRQERRARLWLARDTWAAIDRAASKLSWDGRAPTVIESICEEWAKRQLNRASRATRAFDEKDGTATQDALVELAAIAARAHAWEKSLDDDDANDDNPEDDEPKVGMAW